MNKFDLICTATLRPSLIKRTFDSHIKHLFRDHIKQARLICNVDMVGEDDQQKYLDQIFDYFDSIPFAEIQINVCYQPHFSRAFNWCIGQLENSLTFNLEEDWELGIDLDFERMVELFQEQKNLAHLRLSMFKSYDDSEKQMDVMKTWNKFIEWNGDYFEVPRNLRGTIGWAGHPSLNKTSFLMAFGTVMNKESNHEKQIKGPRPIILNSRFGVYHPINTPPALLDIGREWMREKGFQKKGVKAFFTEWERTPNKGAQK